MTPRHREPLEIVAIGTSTGGVEALHTLVPGLPPDTPPVLVAIHIPPLFSAQLAADLDRKSSLHVREAVDGDTLQSGTVYLCPGGSHLVLQPGLPRQVAIRPGREGDFYKPTIDLLFLSLANNAGPRALGVILTGMGKDGALGLKAMRDAGAHTIGETEESCVIYGMPRAAHEMEACDLLLALPAIAGAIAGQAALRNRPPVGAGTYSRPRPARRSKE